jgi:hypothetical protein
MGIALADWHEVHFTREGSKSDANLVSARRRCLEPQVRENSLVEELVDLLPSRVGVGIDFHCGRSQVARGAG